MTLSIQGTPKKRGRPSTGGRKLGINLRLDPGALSALDAWIAAQPAPRPSRPEAIRLALRAWLALGGVARGPGVRLRKAAK
jgi:hypothetical protein